MSKCPVCGYYAYNGYECFDCGYRSRYAYDDRDRDWFDDEGWN